MAGRINRGVSCAMWQRLAEGESDEELLTWMRQRAAAIVLADQQPAGKRRDALVRALGLAYKADTLAPIAEVIRVANDFDLLDADGNPRPPERGEAMRVLIATVRAVGLVGEDVSDPELRKRIDRAIARDL